MAVPKRRMSKSRKRLRRGHHSAAGPSTLECPRCGSPKLSHRVCDSCGYYRGKKQVEVEDGGRPVLTRYGRVVVAVTR